MHTPVNWLHVRWSWDLVPKGRADSHVQEISNLLEQHPEMRDHHLATAIHAQETGKEIGHDCRDDLTAAKDVYGEKYWTVLAFWMDGDQAAPVDV